MTDLPAVAGSHLPHPKSWQRNLVFGAIATTIVMGWIGDALWASLVDRHPLGLIALNSKPRYLLLTVNEIQTWVFYSFATIRLVAAKPLVWLVGAWYGPRTMVWAEGRSARGGKVVRWMERHFARFGWAIVLVTSNNIVSLLAGSAGMHLGWYVLLATIGTLIRLWLLDLIGEALTKPIDSLIGFVSDHRPAIVAISVTVVVTVIVWERLHGRSGLDELASLEAATEDDELLAIDPTPEAP